MEINLHYYGAKDQGSVENLVQRTASLNWDFIKKKSQCISNTLIDATNNKVNIRSP